MRAYILPCLVAFGLAMTIPQNDTHSTSSKTTQLPPTTDIPFFRPEPSVRPEDKFLDSKDPPEYGNAPWLDIPRITIHSDEIPMPGQGPADSMSRLLWVPLAEPVNVGHLKSDGTIERRDSKWARCWTNDTAVNRVDHDHWTGGIYEGGCHTKHVPLKDYHMTKRSEYATRVYLRKLFDAALKHTGRPACMEVGPLKNQVCVSMQGQRGFHIRPEEWELRLMTKMSGDCVVKRNSCQMQYQSKIGQHMWICVSDRFTGCGGIKPEGCSGPEGIYMEEVAADGKNKTLTWYPEDTYNYKPGEGYVGPSKGTKEDEARAYWPDD